MTQVAREIGTRYRAAERALRKVAWAYPKGLDGTYDARVIDLIHAMHGRPHRTLAPAHADWLAAYLKGRSP